MRRILQIVSWLACAATVLPAVMFLFGMMSLPVVKQNMFAATVVWFVITPFWMGREESS